MGGGFVASQWMGSVRLWLKGERYPDLRSGRYPAGAGRYSGRWPERYPRAGARGRNVRAAGEDIVLHSKISSARRADIVREADIVTDGVWFCCFPMDGKRKALSERGTIS